MKRAAMAAGLAVLAYVVCLWLGFPQYFAPLAPHHSDLYIPVGLLEHSPAELLAYPRPVTFEFAWLIGHLGVKGSIAVVIALIIAAVPLTAYVVEKVTTHRPSALTVSAYSLLLFAHPEFYFQHRHDAPAALSYLLMMIVVLLWWRGSLITAYVVLFALGLTKETYVLATLVLLAAVEWLKNRRVRPAPLVSAAAVMGLAAAYNLWRYHVYVVGAREYEATLAPVALATGYWFYLKHLLTPAAAVLVLCLSSRGLSALFVVAGLTALAPHAILPQHTYAEYAWVAAPLVFAPILTVNTRRMLILVAVGTSITLVSYSLRYDTPARQWAVTQEHRGARVLASLDRLKSIQGNRILVTGLTAVYHPWLDPDFVRHELNERRQWTVLAPRDRALFAKGPVTLARASAVNPAAFDRIVEYAADGGLVNVVRGGPDVLLIPHLKPVLAKLEKAPDDFVANLEAGSEYVAWDLPAQAEPHLRRAVKASQGKNPYPFFFLAQAAEARGDNGAARANYATAAALDPGNAMFREALARVGYNRDFDPE